MANIISSNDVEDKLIHELKVLKLRRQPRRCVYVRTSGLNEDQVASIIELIEKGVDSGEGVDIYSCFNAFFALSEDVPYRNFIRIKEKVSGSVNLDNGKVDELMSIFDLEKDWSKIKRVVDNIIVAKKQAKKVF